MGNSKMSGRLGRSGGSKSVSYYQKALKDKKIKLIPEKKRLKQQIATATGREKKILEKNLSNLDKAHKKNHTATQELRANLPKTSTRYEGPRGTTATYDRWKKKQMAKVAEFFGYK